MIFVSEQPSYSNNQGRACQQERKAVQPQMQLPNTKEI
jgi:hypothetical protein